MFAKTIVECLELAQAFGLREPQLRRCESLKPNAQPTAVDACMIDGSRHVPIAAARSWVNSYFNGKHVLLYVTEFGLFSSRENWHLYYRLRQSYGDFRELCDAPGHFFLAHQRSDVETLLSLCIEFAWGVHFIQAPPMMSFFLSHDGWIQEYSGSRD